MAIKRIVGDRVAEQRTYEKLWRDLDILPQGRPGRIRKQAEMDDIKVRLASRGNAGDG